MTKNAERREKFRKIGQALGQITFTEAAWKDYRGEHQFQMTRNDAGNRLNREGALERVKVQGGPEFKTPQWVRTIAR